MKAKTQLKPQLKSGSKVESKSKKDKGSPKSTTNKPPPPSQPNVDALPRHVEVATRAYFIYLNAGCPAGREMEHWLEAEAQLTRC